MVTPRKVSVRTDERKREPTGHANVGNVEHGKVNERRLDEVDHVALREAIDRVTDAASEDKSRAAGQHPIRPLYPKQRVYQHACAHDERNDAEKPGHVREQAPGSTGVVD